MGVSFEKFLDWADSRFGDVKVSGDEIKINSIFIEDYKHHLSCNPKGGKKQVEHGVYHCWKSEKHGTLVNLVRMVDKCSFEEAMEILGVEDTELADLEARLETFMSKRTPTIEIEKDIQLKLPEHTFPILSLSSDNFWKAEAEAYLEGRKLNPADYLICVDGEYKNRIVIPYYDKNKKLIYWNSRYLNDSKKVAKYLGPNKNCGIGKSDVIYMANNEWPAIGSKLHITEGEFDAKSIVVAGLNAAAIGGKAIEEKQIEMIRGYNPVLCLDTDTGRVDSGGNALLKIGNALKAKGFNALSFVRPPIKFKDWNKMLSDVGPKILHAYIKQNEKPYTDETFLELTIKRI